MSLNKVSILVGSAHNFAEQWQRLPAQYEALVMAEQSPYFADDDIFADKANWLSWLNRV